MRSALFLHDDVNLINRIKITIHDDNAQYYFAESIDDAISILDSKEIAVIFMPYNFDVLSGNEMIEIVLDHNPKAQIISLFKDSELIDVVRSHNVYHLCQIICEDFFKIEDLQSIIETAFNIYNREDDIKAFELTYRQKEDKYKKTILNMSSLLNDRAESFKLICNYFNDTLILLTGNLLKNEGNAVNNYFDNLLNEYINLFLMTDCCNTDYYKSIIDNCNDAAKNRHLMFDSGITSISDDNTCKFIIYAITRYFNDFEYKYRGKLELSEQDLNYSLNIIFEAYPNNMNKSLHDNMLILLEHLFKTVSDKVLFAVKDKIVQYRIIFKKSSL